MEIKLSRWVKPRFGLIEAERKMRKWLVITATTILLNTCLLIFFFGTTKRMDHLVVPVRSLMSMDYPNNTLPLRPEKASSYHNTAIVVTTDITSTTKTSATPDYSRTAIAMRFSEQITMAMYHVYQLARFATEWRARAVLPFINRDMLKTLPNRDSQGLDIIFDLSKLEEISLQHGILPFLDFETFLEKSNRENVYFFRIYYFGKGGKGPVVEQCNTTEEFKIYRTAVANLDREARTRSLPGFSLANTKCCKVRSSKPTVPEDFMTGCGGGTRWGVVHNFTVIIDYWRGYTGMPTKKFRMFVPKYQNKFEIPEFNLPYSKIIEDATIQFIQTLTSGEKFIGVHIRAQKLLIKKKENGTFDDKKCIKDLERLVQQLSRDHPDIKHTIYVADSFIKKYKEPLATELGVNISRFDPSSFNSIENDAFIAQVEQNALSWATILITCGGGSFEKSISLRFKERSPQGIQHKLCQ